MEEKTFLTSVFAFYEPAKFAILYYVAFEWILDQQVRLLEYNLGYKVLYKLFRFQNSLNQITKGSSKYQSQVRIKGRRVQPEVFQFII